MMNAYLYEFLATMVFMFSILASGNPFVIAATLFLGIVIGSKISGGSLNPAVTLGLYGSGKLDVKHVLPYIGAEIAGALLAVQIFKLLKKKKVLKK
tara:strand:- start:5160 stop:5447 length:288 start_codon:yes stop_codon:yes gene_type:complete